MPCCVCVSLIIYVTLSFTQSECLPISDYEIDGQIWCKATNFLKQLYWGMNDACTCKHAIKNEDSVAM